MLGSNLDLDTYYTACGFPEFPQSLQENPGTMPLVYYNRFLPNHYSPVTLLFIVMYEILAALQNKTQRTPLIFIPPLFHTHPLLLVGVSDSYSQAARYQSLGFLSLEASSLTLCMTRYRERKLVLLQFRRQHLLHLSCLILTTIFPIWKYDLKTFPYHFLIPFLFVSFFSLLYCDMTSESQNSPLLGNGLVSTFPLQQIDAVTDEL
jgi:hypothetical protein